MPRDHYGNLRELLKFSRAAIDEDNIDEWRQWVARAGGRRGVMPTALSIRDIRTLQDEVSHLFQQIIAVRSGGRRAAVSLPVSFAQAPEIAVQFAGAGKSRVVIAMPGSPMDRFRFHVARAFENDGDVARIHKCPSPRCQRPFVKAGTAEFCSTTCYAREYMARMRKADRESRERGNQRGRR